MAVVLGHEVGPVICAALGLDPIKVRSISLYFEVGEVAQVEVLQFLEDSETREIVTALRRYELHLIEEPEEVT